MDANDGAQTAVSDEEGSVIVAGYTETGITSVDWLIIKYTDTGVALWTNRYNGPGDEDDAPQSVAVDSAGTVFVTGRSGTGGSYDYATIAYSAAGVPLWTNRYDGPANSNDFAQALTVGGNGTVYVTGCSQGIGTSDDYVTIAYSNAGLPLWTNRYDGPSNTFDEAAAVAVDGSGTVYVTGGSWGSGTDFDYATIAYSSTGASLWGVLRLVEQIPISRPLLIAARAFRCGPIFTTDRGTAAMRAMPQPWVRVGRCSSLEMRGTPQPFRTV